MLLTADGDPTVNDPHRRRARRRHHGARHRPRRRARRLRHRALRRRRPARSQRAEASIHKNLDKGVALGKVAAADAAARQGRGSRSTRDLAAAVDGGRPGDRGGARGDGAQDRDSSARSPRLAPPQRALRHQHLVALDHRDGRRLRPPRALRRHALLQPGAPDEAGRDRARPRDLRRDRRRRCARSASAWARSCVRGARVARLRHLAHQRADRQRGVPHARGGRRLAPRTSTRR